MGSAVGTGISLVDKYGNRVNSADSTISLPDSIHQFYLNAIACIFVEKI